MIEKVSANQRRGKSRDCFRNDQYLIDIVAYDQGVGYYDLGDGPAFTAHKACDVTTNNETGLIENNQAVPFAIVHKFQYCQQSAETARDLASTLGVELPDM